ncbi:hypothetical protein [Xanthomonas graminis]|uniref:hypothetical protein n=1 Tax=Xanthomonas graminis TaxID=3390026 RepID=UPI001112F6B4|nr:hypothetical protein [Xanthomonas translucens]
MAERRLTLAAPEIPGTQTSAGIGPMRFQDAQCERLLHDPRSAGATAGRRNPPARHMPARPRRIAGLQQVHDGQARVHGERKSRRLPMRNVIGAIRHWHNVSATTMTGLSLAH